MLRCPNCAAEIRPRYVVCPPCGAGIEVAGDQVLMTQAPRLLMPAEHPVAGQAAATPLLGRYSLTPFKRSQGVALGFMTVVSIVVAVVAVLVAVGFVVHEVRPYVDGIMAHLPHITVGN